MEKGKLRWRGFFAVAFGTFMATLDFSALTVALPVIARDFNATMADVEWVVVAYVLVISALLLPLGRSGDHWGKHRIFKIGFFLFVVSSLLCSLAQSLNQLVIFRIIQGIGGATYMSVGPAILIDSFPSSERGKAIGFMGTVVSVGLMMGAPFGGLMTHYFSWQMIFFVNVPVGLAGLWWGMMVLRKDVSLDGSDGFDWKGALYCVLATGSFLAILSRYSVWGVRSPWVWGLGTVFIMSAILFFYEERNNPHGVLDFRLFKSRCFTFGNGALFFKFVAINMIYFLGPFYLAEILTYSQQKIGLVMMAIPISFALLNPLSGWLSDRIGTRMLAPFGLSLGCIAFIALSYLTEVSSVEQVFLGLMLVGISSGFFQAPNTSAIFGSVPASRLGTASAFISMMRNYGTVTGVALATMVFSLRVQAYNGVGAQFSVHDLPPYLFMKAFHDTMWVAAGILVLALISSLLRSSDPHT